MPFGLNNTGATYQRMMQNCLRSQIGLNIQVYIDDMVITTRKEESLIDDLKETFDNLERYKLKLNPAKCSFGVPAGQLLGFLLMTHKYRGCIVVLSINKSVKPNEEQKVLMSIFDQGITVNTSKQVFRSIW
jgi:hypothetical protein